MGGMEDELTRYVQVRAWNLARTMVANGASQELVALAYVQVADELMPDDQPAGTVTPDPADPT